MKKLSTQRITLIALFIVINIVGGHIALLAKLPVYLDTIGTLLGASFFGPVGGVVVGILTALINGTTGDLFSIYYMPSQIFTALVAGLIYRKVSATDVKNIWWSALIISVPATIVSSVITVILFTALLLLGQARLYRCFTVLGSTKHFLFF